MNVVNVDITKGLTDIINLFVQFFKYSFNFMRGIQFFGTNLFSFTTTVFLLGVILPILFTLVRSEAVNVRSKREANIRRENYRRRREGNKGD